jgi:hypothetical protein
MSGNILPFIGGLPALSLFHRQYVHKARFYEHEGTFIAQLGHNPILVDFGGITSADQLEAMQPHDCLIADLETQEFVRVHKDEFRTASMRLLQHRRPHRHLKSKPSREHDHV